MVHVSDSKMHVDTQLTPYRKDGSVIGSFESLGIVTTEAGRWGIKLRFPYRSAT
jgi:hypothetical protein